MSSIRIQRYLAHCRPRTCGRQRAKPPPHGILQKTNSSENQIKISFSPRSTKKTVTTRQKTD